MRPEERKRLEVRLETCQSEMLKAAQRLKCAGEDMKHWSNEFYAAQAELNGFKQAELNLTSCPTCGD